METFSRKYVLQVWFDWFIDDKDCPSKWGMFSLVREDGPSTWLKEPLWRPKGLAIFCWATEWVVEGGQQFMVFGPYATKDLAKAAFFRLNLEAKEKTLGYRIYSEREFPLFNTKVVVDGRVADCPDGLPKSMWTDG